MKSNPWITKSSEIIYDNPWIALTEHQCINPGGGDSIYGKVHFKNLAIGILALDQNRDTWLVGQWRYPLNEYSWEIPMGGGALSVDKLESAKRELKEETGVDARLPGLIDIVDGIFTARADGTSGRHYLYLEYACRWLSSEPLAGDDAAEACFFAPDEIESADHFGDMRAIIDRARDMYPAESIKVQ